MTASCETETPVDAHGEEWAEEVYWFRGDDGHLHRLLVTARMKTQLESLDRRAREYKQEWRAQQLVLETDLAGPGEGRQGSHGYLANRPSQQGNAWEGPRLKFPHLLGESRTWDGEPVDAEGECSFCHGAELDRGTYCLGCDRCGRELEVPGGEVRVLRAYRGRRLRGGVG